MNTLAVQWRSDELFLICLMNSSLAHQVTPGPNFAPSHDLSVEIGKEVYSSFTDL